MAIRAAAMPWVTVHADSRRWDHVRLDPGDIVISTPPKSGTTLMQGIVHSLLWPRGDAPTDPQTMSPWIDFRLGPTAEEIGAYLRQQTHRRFVKTHTPGDHLALDDDLRYLVVYRDGRDAILSYSNHRARQRRESVEGLNADAAADGLEPIDAAYDGQDLDYLLSEWFVEASSARHLAGWWGERDRDNVCFVHFNDLLADLSTEMRRIAEFLGLDVPDELWPRTVERCRIDEMRAAAESAGAAMFTSFEGGATRFFDQGTNGRWADVLSETHLARYDAHLSEHLTAEMAAWLELGGPL